MTPEDDKAFERMKSELLKKFDAAMRGVHFDHNDHHTEHHSNAVRLQSAAAAASTYAALVTEQRLDRESAEAAKRQKSVGLDKVLT